MPIPFACAALWLTLAPAPFQASPEADVVALVPADATIVVRLGSSRALEELVHTFAPVAGEAAAKFEVQHQLDELARPGLAPEERPALDAARPLYAAFVFTAEGAGMTLLFPVTNGKAFQLANGRTSLVHGSYTALSTLPTIAVGTGTNPLLAALSPGLVAARLDIARIIATFRPLIEMGLKQAEMELDQLPSEGPFDMQPLLETYLEGARSLLDAARGLDVTIEHDAAAGGEMALRFAYEGGAPRADPAALADLSVLAGLIDPAGQTQAVFNGSWTDVLAGADDFIEAALSMYPEPLRTDMRRLFDGQLELGPLVAPGLAMSVDFAPAGLRGIYALRSPQPAQLLGKLEALARTLDHEDGMVSIGPAETSEVDGLSVRTLQVQLHFDAFFRALLGHAKEGAEVDPAVLEQTETMMNAIYGKELRLALVASEGFAFVAFGHDAAELRADLARLRTPAAPRPEMQRLLHRVEPGSQGFVYHVDFGSTFGQIYDAVQRVMPGPAQPFRFENAVFEIWGSVRGSTWTGGLAMGLADVLAFVRRGQGLEKK